MYRESLELFLECRSNLNAFFREKIIFDFFWQKGNIIFVKFMYICTKYRIPMHFLRKIIFYFPFKEKCFPGKNNIFTDNTRQVIFQCKCFGKNIFLEHLEKWNMAFHAEVKAFLWYICLKLPVYIRFKLRQEVPFTLIFIWYNSEPLGFFFFFLTLGPRRMRRAWKQRRASASSPSPLFALLLSFFFPGLGGEWEFEEKDMRRCFLVFCFLWYFPLFLIKTSLNKSFDCFLNIFLRFFKSWELSSSFSW